MGFLDKVIERLPWMKKHRELERKLREEEQEIFALSLDAARTEVWQILSDASEFNCVEAPVTDAVLQKLQGLGPSLREFFTRYKSVEEVHGDTRLSRDLIGASVNEAHLTRVGEDMEFTEIATEPDSDQVLLLWGETGNDEPSTRYPSIYHFLLANAAARGRFHRSV